MTNAPSRSRYRAHGAFHSELRRRVDLHFSTTGRTPNHARGMFLKTAVMMGWFLTCWALLVFWADSVWTGVPLAVGLGLAVAGIGFSVQHDGGHGGYSRSKWLNGVMAYALDLVGGSSYVWHWKHNVFHHSNPNLTGLDSDIDIQPLCRLTPSQKWYRGHRYQHLYIWALYSFLAVKWHFVDDFRNYLSGTIGGQSFPRPTGSKLAMFVGGKLLFLCLAFVIPSLFHPLWVTVLFYLLTSVTLSLTLAITFQLAHCVEGASFPVLQGVNGQVASDWSRHQVETAANFAPGNRMVSWYVGGLNFQIEHHLFPRVCHMHLKDLAPIVQEVCREHGVNYSVHPTVASAVRSHARWVHLMGQKPLETEELLALAS